MIARQRHPVDTSEQAAVIQAPGGRDVLVVAGAGSGKTYTMTRRIVNLIAEGVPPENILGLTFTRKAASELLARVSRAVLEGGRPQTSATGAFLKPEVSTYDAFFQSIVRQYGLLVGFDQNTQPLSRAGARQIAADVVDTHMDGLLARDFGAFDSVIDAILALSNAISGSMIGDGCTSVQSAITRIRDWDAIFAKRLDTAIGDEPVPGEAPNTKLKARRKRETDQQFGERVRDHRADVHRLCVYRCAQLRDTVAERETLLALVEEYQKSKRRLHMAEFSDFTIAAYQLVTRFPSIGEQSRRRYTHVLLDEYQDTSTTQAMLLATLFHPQEQSGKGVPEHSAVNAVGDPFQSIYAWRGASPGALRMFQQRFDLGESAKPYTLSTTRRNSKVVLEAANNLTAPLRSAPRRAGSSLTREVDVPPLNAMSDAAEGTVGVLAYDTLGQEIDAVARFARHAIARHAPTGAQADRQDADRRPHVAVLFRSKNQLPQFAQGLERAGLTVAMVGYSALLERPEIRDIRALLHAVADHADSASLMRLLATPRYGVKTQDLNALARLADARNTEYRFHALVEAGLADADAPRSRWPALVNEQREQVPNAVFLGDVLADENLGRMLRHSAVSVEGRHAIEQMGTALRQVQGSLNRSLVDVVRAAIEALNLDIDTVVAQAIARSHQPQAKQPVSPTDAHAPMDAVVSLLDVYMRELGPQQSPSLRAFVSWMDALESLDDESAAAPDEAVDVVLMTIHQSKGLEWDAVAVPGLSEHAFPSSQGDNLNIAASAQHPGRMIDGIWKPPEYRESAKTWLTDPAAVPVPVRADAGILPRFPHDAPADAIGANALRGFDNAAVNVETIDDEVFGDLRAGADTVDEATHDAAGDDTDSRFLTQGEEYGRRLHADERRLAYVALTRARYESLMTYSRSSSPSRDPQGAQGHRLAKASNFWNEVHDSLARTRPHTVSGEASQPDGLFAGEAAAEYFQAVVADACNDPPDADAPTETLPWPSELSREVSANLSKSAEAVKRAMSSSRSAGGREAVVAVPEQESLLVRAGMLVDDVDLMTWSNPARGAETGESTVFDRRIRERAKRVLARRRQNVTSLQALAGDPDEHGAWAYWRGLVRPIPQVVSPAAESGTLFHSWAEQFINDFAAGGDMPDAQGRPGVQTRASMLAELARQERDATNGDGQICAKERRLVVWKRRLADSRWAGRRPLAAELQIVATIRRLEGAIVNGKLDAVFYGGLDPEDSSKRFTIVDWKTGAKPGDTQDIERKLVQLDMYRLLLSTMQAVPLDGIDATLYYVNEPLEGRRELHARAKTRQEILAELSSGIPEQSDND